LITRHSKHSSRPDADRRLVAQLRAVCAARGIELCTLRLKDLERIPGREPSAAVRCVVSMSRSAIALDLLDAWAAAGSTVINCPPSVRIILNRPALFARLSACGVVTPRTGWIHKPEAPREGWIQKNPWASHNGFPHNGFHHGNTGRDWRLVQEHLAGGHVGKFYVVGNQVVAAPGAITDSSSTRLAHDLVHKCQKATGADIFGVDILWTAGGPVVVDLNDFPSFSSIAAGPMLLAGHISYRLDHSTRSIRC
jgi:glutathione synthase/RimK-type ligase-like ATP-grasp enzyme